MDDYPESILWVLIHRVAFLRWMIRDTNLEGDSKEQIAMYRA